MDGESPGLGWVGGLRVGVGGSPGVSGCAGLGKLVWVGGWVKVARCWWVGVGGCRWVCEG